MAKKKSPQSLAEQKAELLKQIKASTKLEKHSVKSRNILKEKIKSQYQKALSALEQLSPKEYEALIKDKKKLQNTKELRIYNSVKYTNQLVINHHANIILRHQQAKKILSSNYNKLLDTEKKFNNRLDTLEECISPLENTLNQIQATKGWWKKFKEKIGIEPIGKKTEKGREILNKLQKAKKELMKQEQNFKKGKPYAMIELPENLRPETTTKLSNHILTENQIPIRKNINAINKNLEKDIQNTHKAFEADAKLLNQKMASLMQYPTTKKQRKPRSQLSPSPTPKKSLFKRAVKYMFGRK